MKARIKKTDLVAFKIHASQISKSKELPILDYLKIEVIGDFVSITKTNLIAFAIQTTANDSEDCCFLVDENILFNFVELSDSEYINFVVTGLRVKISDDRHNTSSQTESTNIYPKFELKDNKWVELDDSVLTAVGICAQIVFDDELTGLKNSVFIGDDAVAGSDATIGYWQKFNKELPKMVLRKNVAYSVSKLKSCSHSDNGQYNLFKSGDVLFGFSKSEVPYTYLLPFFKEPKPDAKASFYIHKQLLIKWNTFCINTCKSKSLTATFSANQHRLDLELIESKSEQNNSSYFDIVDGSGDFRFNPSTLNMLLKVLPIDHIHFYPSETYVLNGSVVPKETPGARVDRYYITDKDKTFMSAIMLIN